jgi:hypothetical protein
MHFAALLILATTLVLRSGDRISLDAPPSEQNGVVIFRSGGALYSMPASEIDREATTTANEPAPPQPARKLKVTPAERDRLLKELSQNHAGKPASEQNWAREPISQPAAGDAADQKGDEWKWRHAAREHEESIRQAKENRDLLRDRADRLRSQISGFISQGFKPSSFTYQTTQLARVEEQIPGAELEVQRAERAWEQFRDDARRQGILPGWLR